jgi:septum formation protein
MTSTIILASASPFRRMLLENAGIAFSWQAADIDERAIEAPLAGHGASAGEIARVLAEAKAVSVAKIHSSALVIGSDQTLSLRDRVFHKPRSREDAHRHLRALSGETHQLNSAVVLCRGGDVIWSHVAIARLTMRPLSERFIVQYLARIGDKALSSVGAYQLEAEGVQLFETIEGDYFTILGLPLLPLLSELRHIGILDA